MPVYRKVDKVYIEEHSVAVLNTVKPYVEKWDTHRFGGETRAIEVGDVGGGGDIRVLIHSDAPCISNESGSPLAAIRGTTPYNISVLSDHGHSKFEAPDLCFNHPVASSRNCSTGMIAHDVVEFTCEGVYAHVYLCVDGKLGKVHSATNNSSMEIIIAISLKEVEAH